MHNTNVNMCVCMCACMCICICTHACMCIYVFFENLPLGGCMWGRVCHLWYNFGYFIPVCTFILHWGQIFCFTSFIALFIMLLYISNKTPISIYIDIYWLLDTSHLRGHTLLVQLAAHIFVLVSLQELYNWPGLSVNLGVLVTQDTLVWAPLYLFLFSWEVYIYYIVIVLYVI